MAELLAQTEAEVECVCADGAYDFEHCYRAIKQKRATALIPPREAAVVRGKSPFGQRDENVQQVESTGRKEWKKASAYHKRSLVECAFLRLETIFSDRLRSRTVKAQTAEANIRRLALNRMTKLGMAKSYAV